MGGIGAVDVDVGDGGAVDGGAVDGGAVELSNGAVDGGAGGFIDGEGDAGAVNGNPDGDGDGNGDGKNGKGSTMNQINGVGSADIQGQSAESDKNERGREGGSLVWVRNVGGRGGGVQRGRRREEGI